MLVTFAFGSALMDETAGWLVRFVHPAFSYMKVAGFLALQTSLLGLIVALGYGVLRPGRNAYTDSEKKRAA